MPSIVVSFAGGRSGERGRKMRAWTGRVIDGKYRLEHLIGEGGMGVVYEAQHEVLLRPLAVKLLSPSYSMDPSVSRRFLREAQAAGRIGHDNICEVLDFGSTPEGVLYMVMPLLKGGTLATAISACRVVPLERTVDIISQTLDALAAAHSHGIVHRDLKPENIFLTTVASRADFVKVFDFGIAKILSPDPTPSGVSPHLTKTGTVMGTIAYMAPEQARGDPDVDHRADLYSVGAILYEMLTGVRMYDGATFNQVLHKVLLGEMKAPSELRPDIPMEFESVIMRAVARIPDRRYPDAIRFRRALAGALAAVRAAEGAAPAANAALPPVIAPTERAEPSLPATDDGQQAGLRPGAAAVAAVPATTVPFEQAGADTPPGRAALGEPPRVSTTVPIGRAAAEFVAGLAESPTPLPVPPTEIAFAEVRRPDPGAPPSDADGGAHGEARARDPGSSVVTAGPNVTLQTVLGQTRRRGILAAGGLAVLLVLGGVAYLLLTHQTSTPSASAKGDVAGEPSGSLAASPGMAGLPGEPQDGGQDASSPVLHDHEDAESVPATAVRPGTPDAADDTVSRASDEPPDAAGDGDAAAPADGDTRETGLHDAAFAPIDIADGGSRRRDDAATAARDGRDQQPVDAGSHDDDGTADGFDAGVHQADGSEGDGSPGTGETDGGAIRRRSDDSSTADVVRAADTSQREGIRRAADGG
jgi:serine/threonine-protein kinase